MYPNDPYPLVPKNLPNQLALTRPDIAPAYLSIPNKQKRRHLHYLHIPQKLHTAVVLVPIHPRKHHRVRHRPRQLQHGRVHLHARPAVLEPHVQHNQLPVRAVGRDQLLHVPAAVDLDHAGVPVPLVRPYRVLLVNFFHPFVEAEVGDAVDFFAGAEPAGLLGLVSHHEKEVDVAAIAAEVDHKRVDLAAVVAVAGGVFHDYQAAAGQAEGRVEFVGAVDPLDARGLDAVGSGRGGGFCGWVGVAGGYEVDGVGFGFGFGFGGEIVVF
ncbi:histidine--tRNA ligase [Striga asiatica]|uniref:Histidine--tRNA ligase n=1 Tax=Striga asiatica TaxID=4170 RepID=A0A5A7PCV4_STRAF|nr:histidine--tRNA ligase [Striga asiatica]